MPTRHDAPSAGGAAGEDLYAVLGVARTSTNDEIRKAYRKLARKCHPDVNPGDKSAEERFKQISRAHDALSDEKRRALYDEFGTEALQSGFDADRARQLRDWQRATRGGAGTGAGARPRRGRASSSAGERGFGGFEDLFGGMFSRGAVSERGADVEVAVPTPEGDVALRIPAGTQSGRRLRLRGKGVPALHGGERGDLYVRIMVQVPEDDDRVRAALGSLEAAYKSDVRKDLRL